MKAVKTNFKKFAAVASVVGVAGTVLIAFLSSAVHLFIFLGTYAFIFGLMSSNFYVMSKKKLDQHRQFLMYLYGSIAFRFFVAIGVLVVGLKILNNFQIFFSVSFIFSYICNSVIEVIYLSKIIKTES